MSHHLRQHLLRSILIAPSTDPTVPIDKDWAMRHIFEDTSITQWCRRHGLKWSTFNITDRKRSWKRPSVDKIYTFIQFETDNSSL